MGVFGNTPHDTHVSVFGTHMPVMSANRKPDTRPGGASSPREARSERTPSMRPGSDSMGVFGPGGGGAFVCVCGGGGDAAEVYEP